MFLHKLRYKNLQAGFTLLEIVIVIALIGFLGLIVLDRSWKFRVYAEEAAVTAIIGNIRSALGLEVAVLVVRGQSGKIPTLDKSNPMDFLAQKPNNYLGAVDNPASITETGIWYFDNNEQTLNYIAIYKEQFESNIKGIKRTRHQIKMVYSDNNKNNRFDHGIDDISGLDLVAMEPYRWVLEK